MSRVDVRRTWLMLLSLATACGPFACGPAAPSAAETRLRPGTWGGNHLRVDATATGAVLEFDCARGAIDGAVELDRQGRFSRDGTYAPEGGPQIFPPPEPMRARYAGRVDGDEMWIEVVLIDQRDAPREEFVVRFGSAARLTKCY